MIIADTDILSALAKVGRMSLLLSLFNTTEHKVVSKLEVEEIIRDLGVKDRMRFRQSTLDAILADP
jgi:predicted nucleic acid-binding protein